MHAACIDHCVFMNEIKKLVLTASKRNFLRVNAQMHNLDLAKNGARPQNVSGKAMTNKRNDIDK